MRLFISGSAPLLKSTFEEFQRTGLNNFDFLSYEYYIEDFEIEE